MIRRGVVPASALALLYQSLLTFFTSFYTGTDGAYGAPLPVGTSCGFCIVSLGGGTETFAWLAFTLNVAVTAALIWSIARLGGHLGFAATGGLAFFVLALAMYFAMRSGAPFAGLPVPIAVRSPHTDVPRLDALALWLDTMAGAALFALPSLLRRQSRTENKPRLRSPLRG